MEGAGPPRSIRATIARLFAAATAVTTQVLGLEGLAIGAKLGRVGDFAVTGLVNFYHFASAAHRREIAGRRHRRANCGGSCAKRFFLNAKHARKLV
jgi:hypothetical protein